MTVNTNGQRPELTTRIFTFGFGHKHPETGQSLGRMYVIIKGATGEHCRAEMMNRFGRKWAFEYRTPEDAGVERYDLKELPSAEWPPSSDQFYVDPEGVLQAR